MTPLQNRKGSPRVYGSLVAIDDPIGPPLKPRKLAPPETPRNKVTEWVTLEDGIQMRASSQRLEDAEAWVAKVCKHPLRTRP